MNAMQFTGIVVAAVVLFSIIVWLSWKRNHRDDVNMPETTEPPTPTYNDTVVSEAEEIGHGVYVIDFWVRDDDGSVNHNFPESLAYFVKEHPSLRIVNVCAGREDSYGNTMSMVILTEPRTT